MGEILHVPWPRYGQHDGTPAAGLRPASGSRYGSGVTVTMSRDGSRGRNAIVTLEKAEIRQRAYAFVRLWAGSTSEQSDKQPFGDAFFGVFGVQRRQVATYEAIDKRATTGRHGWVDLLLPGQMAVEHKSLGQSLDDAMVQLIDYLPSLPPAEHPWLLVVSDFAKFEWKNLDTGAVGSFTKEKLY